MECFPSTLRWLNEKLFTIENVQLKKPLTPFSPYPHDTDLVHPPPPRFLSRLFARHAQSRVVQGAGRVQCSNYRKTSRDRPQAANGGSNRAPFVRAVHHVHSRPLCCSLIALVFTRS